MEIRANGRTQVVGVEMEIKGCLNLHDIICTQSTWAEQLRAVSICMVGLVRRVLCGGDQGICVG